MHPPGDDEYWGPLNYQDRISALDVPALHVTGWYDDVQPGTMINFQRMTEEGCSARTKQRLVVGPWDHGLTRVRGRNLGPIDFGPESAFDLDNYEVAFLSAHLNRTAPPANDFPVKIFVMGANTWRDEDEWPLARTSWTDYYLSSRGNANTKDGDGELARSPSPASAGSHDTFIYDPADPVPFITAPTSSQIGGPDDYSTVEDRSDVLVYSTSSLDHDVEATGPVRAVLFVSSSAVDTDFVARLIDRHPNGFCQRICDGVVRTRYREGRYRDLPMVPGEVYEVDIDLWSTSHVFLPGHQIRLEVTSSAFPKYDPNTNTGEDPATATTTISAENRVWHGAAVPFQAGTASGPLEVRRLLPALCTLALRVASPLSAT